MNLRITRWENDEYKDVESIRDVNRVHVHGDGQITYFEGDETEHGTTVELPAGSFFAIWRK